MRTLIILLFLTTITFAQEKVIELKNEKRPPKISNNRISKLPEKNSNPVYTIISTNDNEKAPFLVGTSSTLYAVLEVTPEDEDLTRIRVYYSNDDGENWEYFRGFYNSSHSLVLPQAYIENGNLYVSYDRVWSQNDHDVYVATIDLSSPNDGWEFDEVAATFDNEFRSSVVVDDGDVYVAYFNTGSNKFVISKGSTGSDFSNVHDDNFSSPSYILRVDGTNGSGSDMFCYNTKINGKDQVRVVKRAYSSNWNNVHITSGSGEKSSPSIGSYGNNWIVTFQNGATTKYFYQKQSVSSVMTLANNTSYPTVDMTDAPSGSIVAVYEKNDKIYKKSTLVTQLPSFGSESVLQSDFNPSDEDFISLWPSHSHAGVAFAWDFGPDFDVFFSPTFEEPAYLYVSDIPSNIDLGPEGAEYNGEIGNTGEEALDWSVDAPSWIDVDPSDSEDIAGGEDESLTITIDEYDEPGGTRSYTLKFENDDNSSNYEEIDIEQEGPEPSELEVSCSLPSSVPQEGGNYDCTAENTGEENLSWGSEAPDWVNINPQSDNLNGGNDMNVEIEIDPNNSTNSRSGTIRFYNENNSNDDKNYDFTQPGLNSPQLCISDGQISHDFGSVGYGDNPDPNEYSFTVKNCGEAELKDCSIEENANWIDVSTDNDFNLTQGETKEITIEVSTDDLEGGESYSETITVTSDNGGEASGNVEVEVNEAPNLATNNFNHSIPSDIHFDSDEEEKTYSGEFDVENTGGGSLEVECVVNENVDSENLIDITITQGGPFTLTNNIETFRFEVVVEKPDEDLSNYDYEVNMVAKTTDGSQEKIAGTIEDPNIITDVNRTNIAGNVPEEFFLGNAYPNPFNPTTTLRFGIPEASQVNLQIYDVSGKLVENIIPGNYLDAGTYEYKFNAEKLSSGIYLYKLSAESNISEENIYETKKLLLLK